jgi:hypothetical protein
MIIFSANAVICTIGGTIDGWFSLVYLRACARAFLDSRVCWQHLRIALALGNIGFLIIWRGEVAPKLAWVATAMARALNMYHMGLALTVPLRSVFDWGSGLARTVLDFAQVMGTMCLNDMTGVGDQYAF